MVQFQIGDNVTFCASIRDFCSSMGGPNFYLLYDINCTVGTCNITIIPSWTCLSSSGIQLEFQWVDTRSNSAAKDCLSHTLRVLGTDYTSSSGVASINHTIDQTDLDLYNANQAGFELRVCIKNTPYILLTNIGRIRSDISYHSGDYITIGQNLCYGVTCKDICIGNDLYYQACNPTNGQCIQGTLKEANSLTCQSTHYIDVKIKAHSWYTPGGAADWIVTKVADINGSLINLFSGITDYQYLGVTIFTDAGHVIIRAHLKQLSTASLAAPLLAEIAAIVAMIFYIVVVVGIIVGVYLITSTIQRVFGKDYTKSEVGGLLNDILQRNLDNCDNNFPNDPVGYANCIKSGIQSVTGAGGDFFEDPVITQSGDTAATAIDACTTQYNIDHDATKLTACVSVANGGVQDTIGKETCKDGTWNSTAKKCEKATNWGTILLYGGIVVVGIVVLTRK